MSITPIANIDRLQAQIRRNLVLESPPQAALRREHYHAIAIAELRNPFYILHERTIKTLICKSSIRNTSLPTPSHVAKPR